MRTCQPADVAPAPGGPPTHAVEALLGLPGVGAAGGTYGIVTYVTVTYSQALESRERNTH